MRCTLACNQNGLVYLWDIQTVRVLRHIQHTAVVVAFWLYKYSFLYCQCKQSSFLFTYQSIIKQ